MTSTPWGAFQGPIWCLWLRKRKPHLGLATQKQVSGGSLLFWVWKLNFCFSQHVVDTKIFCAKGSLITVDHTV